MGILNTLSVLTMGILTTLQFWLWGFWLPCVGILTTLQVLRCGDFYRGDFERPPRWQVLTRKKNCTSWQWFFCWYHQFDTCFFSTFTQELYDIPLFRRSFSDIYTTCVQHNHDNQRLFYEKVRVCASQEELLQHIIIYEYMASYDHWTTIYN